MADKKNSFLLYKDQWEAISDLDDKYLGQLFRAIYEYQIHGKVPENHSIIFRDFKHFKSTFTRDSAKYQEVLEDRIEAGRRGGLQKAANLANARNTKQNKQTLANVPDSDSVSDLLSTPLSPSLPSGKEGKKKRPTKTREETSKEVAVSYYKTECEAAAIVAPGPAAENYRQLALEICGKKTLECPNGMVKTLMRLPEQLSFEQYQKLCDKMGGHSQVRDMLIEMHTSFDEHVKSKNTIYGVCNNWHNRRMKGEGKTNGIHVQNGQPKVSKPSSTNNDYRA